MKLAAMLLMALPVFALPHMVRLGYPNCLSCHVNPQGGGLLNTYGKGIDAAQSWRAEEYKPSSLWLAGFLRAGGRVEQDFRVVTSEQLNSVPNGPLTGLNRSRFFYRNVTNLGRAFAPQPSSAESRCPRCARPSSMIPR